MIDRIAYDRLFQIYVGLYKLGMEQALCKGKALRDLVQLMTTICRK